MKSILYYIQILLEINGGMYMHRFSYMLRWPPKPAVWFMSEWRAVAIEQARIYADLPNISSSFEMAGVIKWLKITTI